MTVKIHFVVLNFTVIMIFSNNYRQMKVLELLFLIIYNFIILQPFRCNIFVDYFFHNHDMYLENNFLSLKIAKV